MRVQSRGFILRRYASFHEGETQLEFRVFRFIKRQVFFSFHTLQAHCLAWIKPPTTSLLLGTIADLARGKSELIAENALLRQQLIILHRQIKRPVYRKTDRLLLVLLARMVWAWKQALFLVQPETLLRWHRELFRVFWKHKSKARSRKSRLSPETISLIKEMAANNRLWGAERIRGELLKLDIRRSQTDDSEVYEVRSPQTSRWAELENVPAPSCGRGVGL
jgi:putative transposase